MGFKFWRKKKGDEVGVEKKQDNEKEPLVESRKFKLKVSVEKAQLHRNLTTPNWGPSEGFKNYSIYRFPKQLFYDYGIGIFLFFDFNYQIGVIGILLVIVSSPAIHMALRAGKMPQSIPFGCEQTSIGNLGTVDEENPDVIVTTVMWGRECTMREAMQVWAIVDFICIFGFGIFLFLTERRIVKKSLDADDKTTSAADYAIIVENLPENVDTISAQQMKNFFEEWGRIINVSICYNDGDLIEMYLEKADINQSLQIAKKRYEIAKEKKARIKSAKEVEKLTKLLEACKVDLENLEDKVLEDKIIVCAFITFDNQESKIKCIQDIMKESWKPRFLREQKYKIEGKAIKVGHPNEPSSIMYHNLKYGIWSKRRRACFSWLTTGGIMIVSLSTIAALSLVQEHTPTMEACDPVPTKLEADTAVEDRETKISCYCMNAGPEVYEVKEELEFCKDYVKSSTVTYMVTTVQSFFITTVNNVLSTILEKLVDAEKHSNLSVQQASLATKIFWAAFFNTAILTVILNSDLSMFTFIPMEMTGYKDFDSDWCYGVGVGILTTMIMSSVQPYIMDVIKIPVGWFKRTRAINKCVTQDELNKAWDGQEFGMSDRYADMAMKTCFIIMFAQIFPIVWIICAASGIATYWLNKILFLRVMAIPPKFDESLSLYSVQLLKFGVLLHLLIAIWVFGRPYRDPLYMFSYGDPANRETLRGTMLAHVFNYNSIFFFLYLLGMLIENFYRTILKGFFKCGGIKVRAQPGIETYTKAYSRGEYFENYMVSHQKAYKNAFGPGLMPVETHMSKKALDKERRAYRLDAKKQRALELYEGVIEDSDDENIDSGPKIQISKENPKHWSALEVGAWIQSMGEDYRPYMYSFLLQEIEGHFLIFELDEQFLEEELEIDVPRHRQKILKHLIKLRLNAGVLKTKEEREAEAIERERTKQTKALKTYIENRPYFEKWTKYACGFEYSVMNPAAKEKEVRAEVENRWKEISQLEANESRPFLEGKVDEKD